METRLFYIPEGGSPPHTSRLGASGGTLGFRVDRVNSVFHLSEQFGVTFKQPEEVLAAKAPLGAGSSSGYCGSGGMQSRCSGSSSSR